MLSTMVGHTTGVNMAVDHWVSDLDITRTRVSAIWTASLFISGAFLPLAGALLDKLGSRNLALLASVPYVAAVFLMGCVRSSLHLSLCLIALRFLGPECLILVATVTPNKWFIRQRGRVAALLSIFDVGNIAFSSMFQALIVPLGWRDSYKVLSAIIGALLVLCVLILKDDPKVLA